MSDNLFFSTPAPVLFGTGLIAGALNGVAGGGSFITFPTLVLTGLSTINANATNNTVTWVGYLASIRAYHPAQTITQPHLVALGSISILGGIVGSLLLLHTPQALFTKLLPYLLLIATLLFSCNPIIADWVGHHNQTVSQPSRTIPILSLVLQFLIAVYGGFFGGGSGMLMLAMFTIAGMKDIHAMNALKTLLNACINGVAMLLFISAGTIAWSQALLMSFGSLLGGYWGVCYIQTLPVSWVRRFIILVGFGMTAYFFIKSG
jgi:uncharacterized membrane protein YfcA